MRKGTTHSEATRLKMRLAKLGKPGNRLGYRLTEDQKKHLSLVMTGKKHCLKTRKKIRITALNSLNSLITLATLNSLNSLVALATLTALDSLITLATLNALNSLITLTALDTLNIAVS